MYGPVQSVAVRKLYPTLACSQTTEENVYRSYVQHVTLITAVLSFAAKFRQRMHTVKSAVRQRLSVVQVALEQASGLKSNGMARAHLPPGQRKSVTSLD